MSSIRPARPSFLLPGTLGIAQALDKARSALCAFLTMGTDLASLEQWLLGPYREATQFGTKTQAVAIAENEEAILSAQRRTARVIEAAGLGGEALTKILPSVVHIRPAHDRFGGKGFVPLDVPGTRLVDKAIALALADYFTRPDEFLAHDYSSAAGPLRRISSEMCAVSDASDKRAQ